jgi:hypothetical protein
VEMNSLSAMTLTEIQRKIEWGPEFVDVPNHLSTIITGATLSLSNALCDQTHRSNSNKIYVLLLTS